MNIIFFFNYSCVVLSRKCDLLNKYYISLTMPNREGMTQQFEHQQFDIGKLLYMKLNNFYYVILQITVFVIEIKYIQVSLEKFVKIY